MRKALVIMGVIVGVFLLVNVGHGYAWLENFFEAKQKQQFMPPELYVSSGLKNTYVRQAFIHDNKVELSFIDYYRSLPDTMKKRWVLGASRRNYVDIRNPSDSRVLTNIVIELRLPKDYHYYTHYFSTFVSGYDRSLWSVSEAKINEAPDSFDGGNSRAGDVLKVVVSRILPRESFAFIFSIATDVSVTIDDKIEAPIEIILWSPDNPMLFLKKSFTYQLEKTPSGEWR